MLVKPNHYQTLGIKPSATSRELNEAYRKLAFQYHPDRNQNNPEADLKMRVINEAYATLTDPIKRKEYDLPLGYNAITPKFKIGGKVKINSHSASPYRDHTGTVDQEPAKDAFRFWYMVRFDMKGYSTISHFAEEELSKIDD